MSLSTAKRALIPFATAASLFAPAAFAADNQCEQGIDVRAVAREVVELNIEQLNPEFFSRLNDTTRGNIITQVDRMLDQQKNQATRQLGQIIQTIENLSQKRDTMNENQVANQLRRIDQMGQRFQETFPIYAPLLDRVNAGEISNSDLSAAVIDMLAQHKQLMLEAINVEAAPTLFCIQKPAEAATAAVPG